MRALSRCPVLLKHTMPCPQSESLLGNAALLTPSPPSRLGTGLRCAGKIHCLSRAFPQHFFSKAVPFLAPLQHPPPLVCRGNFTFLPAIIALDSDNVGLWLGRADGYMANELFFFGVNTGIRLGFAPGCVAPSTSPLLPYILCATQSMAVEAHTYMYPSDSSRWFNR